MIRSLFTACKIGNAGLVGSILADYPQLRKARTKSGLNLEQYARSQGQTALALSIR